MNGTFVTGTMKIALLESHSLDCISGGIDQQSLFNSYYCPVQLIAHFTDDSEETGDFFMEEVVWTNFSVTRFNYNRA